MSDVLAIKKNKLPIIKQVQFSECGHACVAMIANYYGHNLDLYYLRALHEPSINGTSLLGLMQLLDKLKLKSRAIQIDISELHQLRCPVILHWNMNHFVVLKSISSNEAVIHDPAVGKRKISLQELSNSFTGIVLEIERSEDFSFIKSTNTLSIMDLFKQVHGLKNSLLVLLFLSLVIELFVLANPIFIQYITDTVVNTNNLNSMYVVAIGFSILTISHSYIEYMRSHFVVYLTNRMSEYFSSAVMSHLLKLPHEYFVKRHKGDILSRFHSINDIQSKITTDSINTLLDGIVILFALMIMSIYSWQLTCIVSISLIGYLTIRILSYRHLKNQTEISVAEHARVNSRFLEIIQSIMPVKLYSKELPVYRDWKNYFIKAMNADIKIARVNILYNTANLCIFNIEHILVLVIGAFLVINNRFSVGMLVAFLAYRQTLVNKATTFMHKIFEYKLVSVQLDRVADILLQPIEAEDNATIIKDTIQGAIEVQNLAYHYPGNSQFILSNICFQINPGEKVVITGPSGRGKTTLLKIISGLLVPTCGNVLIDGIALNILGLKRYRAACASVMQDDTLISGSILDNITFMDGIIDIEKVYEVAKLAQIHEDIVMMPMSYETLIGDMGSSLSGGQKQRVLLARALYKKPKILLLDEATSHLDLDKEIKINQALKQLKITQIVIAHREESTKMADRIIDLGERN